MIDITTYGPSLRWKQQKRPQKSLRYQTILSASTVGGCDPECALRAMFDNTTLPYDRGNRIAMIRLQRAAPSGLHTVLACAYVCRYEYSLAVSKSAWNFSALGQVTLGAEIHRDFISPPGQTVRMAFATSPGIPLPPRTHRARGPRQCWAMLVQCLILSFFPSSNSASPRLVWLTPKSPETP